MAGAVACSLAILSADGDGEMPAGDATDDGNMKSSRFIGSDWRCDLFSWFASTDFRSCAMPLGALDAFLLLVVRARLAHAHQYRRHANSNSIEQKYILLALLLESPQVH